MVNKNVPFFGSGGISRQNEVVDEGYMIPAWGPDGRWGAATPSQIMALGSVVRPEAFGGKADGRTDNAPAITRAVAYLRSKGGGILQFSAGTYLVRSGVRVAPGVHFTGCGIDTTFIKVAVDDISIFRPNISGVDGAGSINQMTLWGYADRNSALGNFKLVDVNGLSDFELYRVKAIYSRNMSFAVAATRVSVRNCIVQNSNRDAINVAGSTWMSVCDNIVDGCGDDAIAVSGTAAVGLYAPRIVVTGNMISKSFGIKSLCSRNATISNNTLRFWYGYGINVSLDDSFNEGMGARHGLTIEGNTFEDGINASRIGAGTVRHAIIIYGGESLGSGATTWPVYEGQLVSPGVIQRPYPYVNQEGVNLPRPPSSSITISGNVLKQTIESVPGFPITKFSDSGFGLLYTNSGFQDPAMTTLINEVDFLYIAADLRTVRISDNICEGGRWLVNSTSAKRFDDVAIENNIAWRVRGGVLINNVNPVHGRAFIEGNLFNVDPLFDHPDHNATDGTWSSNDGSDAFGVLLTNVYGAVIRENKYLNCKRGEKLNTSIAQIEANQYFWDWAGGTARGIALVPAEDYLGDHFRYDANPSSGTYGQISIPADSAYVKSGAAMPTTGYYRRGQFVTNNNVAIASSKTLQGWFRLTTGNAHVLGTDWAAQYIGTIP